MSPIGTWIYRGGGVGLATSGSGDVLAGVIAGLAARGASAEEAAIWGVYLHAGESGAKLAAAIGPLGFLAREIADLIPRLMVERCGPRVGISEGIDKTWRFRASGVLTASVVWHGSEGFSID